EIAGGAAFRVAARRGRGSVLRGRGESAEYPYRHRDVAAVAGARTPAAGDRGDGKCGTGQCGAVAESEMSQRPITEDDLHAYVDRALEPERQAEVASYLTAHPDVAQRVAGFSDQRELLRTALAPIAEEPLPPELNLSRIIESRRQRPRV